MKRTLSLILTVVILTMCFCQSAGAVNVIMNSSYLKFPDQEPVIENGSTLVPIRPVSEALGLTVEWNEAKQLVTLKSGSFFIELTIGNTTAVTSSGVKTLANAPKIIGGRTMVPLRFIAETMGLTVLWNDEYQRVVINGRVDTTVKAPSEQPSETASSASEESPEALTRSSAEINEESTEAFDDTSLLNVPTPSGSITFEIPASFVCEDTSSEESFAYRSIDATDIQHLYNWDRVTSYESYADGNLKNGIIVITEEYAPYEGGDIDVSRINEEYPQAPVAPEINWPELGRTAELMLFESIFDERGVEMPVPENIGNMSEEELAEILKFETVDEYNEYISAALESFDMNTVPGYTDYAIYQEERNEYIRNRLELDNIKKGAMRNFSSLASKTSDDEWAALFNSMLNTDPEVRYEGIEILTINDKKIIHGTIHAEDPDDEQGTYDYYLYYDGDTRITIYGGTLWENTASPEAVEALSRMSIN